MHEAVEGNVFPGAVLLVSQAGRVIFHQAYGLANIFTGQAMTTETIFDLASLTKPLATTPAVMLLIKEKRLALAQTIASVLPEFRQTEKETITIEQLLAHHSGLPDYRPYYETLRDIPPAKRKARLRELLVEEPLANPVGETAVYSDLGFMVLNWLVETVAGKTLDRLAEERIYKPLGLKLFFPGLGGKKGEARFAATENCPWRKTVLQGAVHDDNAYVVGGVEGHAGLFGTAEAVNGFLARLSAVYAEKDALVFADPPLLRRFFTRCKNSERALGFDTPAKKDASCGRHFSKESVGHLGFTGTSFWLDLEKRIIVVLLTNRVHPNRENVAIRAFRPKIHDLVMESLGTG